MIRILYISNYDMLCWSLLNKNSFVLRSFNNQTRNLLCLLCFLSGRARQGKGHTMQYNVLNLFHSLIHSINCRHYKRLYRKAHLLALKLYATYLILFLFQTVEIQKNPDMIYRCNEIILFLSSLVNFNNQTNI